MELHTRGKKIHNESILDVLLKQLIAMGLELVV